MREDFFYNLSNFFRKKPLKNRGDFQKLPISVKIIIVKIRFVSFSFHHKLIYSVPRSIKTDIVYGPFLVRKRWKNGVFTAVNGVNTHRKQPVSHRLSGRSFTVRILSVPYTGHIWPYYDILRIKYDRLYFTVL
jgi:hypothetical protein